MKKVAKKKWRAQQAKANRKVAILSAGDLPPLLEHLRHAGRQPSPTLLERIRVFGTEAVQPLVAMALDERLHRAGAQRPEVWAPLHALRLLGELDAAEAAEALLPLFEWDDDWLAEQLPETYAQFGRPALAPLRTLLFDRGRSALARSGAAQALARLAQAHPDLRGEVVAALAAHLDPAEAQTPDDEVVNADAVRSLLELKGEEVLPAVRRAFEEERVDRMFIDYRDVEEAFGLPPEPRLHRGGRARPEQGMMLRLRCTACGFARDHWVERVYCDLGTVERQQRGEETPYDAYVIPQRIVCPKCGAADRYELTSMAHLALTAELLRLRYPAPGVDVDVAEQESPLSLVHWAAAGREMHPYEARDWYRQRMDEEPRDPDLHVRYASVLRTLGHAEDAMSHYRQALALDPHNLESAASLADLLLGAAAEREVEDAAAADASRAEARRLLEQAVQDARGTPDPDPPPSQREMLVSFAQQTLAALEGGTLGHHPRLGPSPRVIPAVTS